MARKKSGGSGQSCVHSWGGWSGWTQQGSVYVRTRKCGATEQQVS